MNYKLQYDNLIERSKNRKLEGYFESHHIIPKCMGGGNDKSNLAKLTAREHYIAHQLLVKMYPENYGLVYAAYNLCFFSKTNKERKITNRLYEWLKIKHAKSTSILQSGNGNSQYGCVWISNEKEKICKKIKKEELHNYLENGWLNKRIENFDLYFKRKKDKEKKENFNKIKKNKKEEYIKKHNEYYEIYNLYGFEKFKEITNYKFSYPNLVNAFKKYVKKFIPQNRIKRGSELIKEIKEKKFLEMENLYNKYYISYIKLNSNFNEFKKINNYPYKKHSLLYNFRKYVKDYKK